eukprot:scaffold39777_cov189-Skeletonema_dohrnii-CCMP3373.AAC.1
MIPTDPKWRKKKSSTESSTDDEKGNPDLFVYNNGSEESAIDFDYIIRELTSVYILGSSTSSKLVVQHTASGERRT